MKLINNYIILLFFTLNIFISTSYAINDIKQNVIPQHENNTQASPIIQKDINAYEETVTKKESGSLSSISINPSHIAEHILAEIFVFLMVIILTITRVKQYVENRFKKFEDTFTALEKKYLKGIPESEDTENVMINESGFTKYKVVKKINFLHEGLQEYELVREFIKTKAVKREWDRTLVKPFKFDWESFFNTEEKSYVKVKIADEIIKRYKNSDISAIILIPYESTSTAIPIPFISDRVVEDLQGQIKNIKKITLNENFKKEKEPLKQFNNDDKILVIQPVANAPLVTDIDNYIRDNIKADVKGIIAIFDLVSRTPHSKEDILIKLNLDGNIAE